MSLQTIDPTTLARVQGAGVPAGAVMDGPRRVDTVPLGNQPRGQFLGLRATQERSRLRDELALHPIQPTLPRNADGPKVPPGEVWY